MSSGNRPPGLNSVVKMPSACQELQKEDNAVCKREGEAVTARKA